MPIYEYECPACRERFEKLVRSSAAQVGVACPSCGEKGARRLISSFASVGLGSASAASAGGGGNCAPSGGG